MNTECQNCKFFVLLKEVEGEKHGNCHRFPPSGEFVDKPNGERL